MQWDIPFVIAESSFPPKHCQSWSWTDRLRLIEFPDELQSRVEKERDKLKNEYIQLINKLCPSWIYYLIDKMMVPEKKTDKPLQIETDENSFFVVLRVGEKMDDKAKELFQVEWKQLDAKLPELNDKMKKLDIPEVSTLAWREREALLKEYVDLYRDFVLNDSPQHKCLKYVGLVQKQVEVTCREFGWMVDNDMVFVGEKLPWDFHVTSEQIQKERNILNFAKKAFISQ